MKRTLLTLVLSLSCFSLNGMQREAPLKLDPITRITRYSNQGLVRYDKIYKNAEGKVERTEAAEYNPAYGYSGNRTSGTSRYRFPIEPENAHSLFNALEREYNHQQN